MKQTEYDIVIVGGGMVGAAVALGLAKQGHQILLLEQRLPQPFSSEQPADIRVSAISAGSIELLNALGAWQHILAMRTRPLTGLSVWEQADARTDFHASELDQAFIGHMVENRIIQLGLYKALANYKNVSWITDNELISITHADNVKLSLVDGSVLHTSLLIGADGVNSKVRQLINVGTSGWHYRQQALGVLIRCESDPGAVTWQQFYPSGPRAFLPMYAEYASLVWYDSKEQIDQLKQLPNTKLKDAIRTSFPQALPSFEVEQYAAFPLQRLHADKYFHNHVVLVGDAAHCINPLAGQGVNLGFKDVRVLLEKLSELTNWQDEQSLRTALAAYQRKRMPDNLLMMSAMDLLYKGFSNDLQPIKQMRNIGLKLANSLPFAKQQALKYAMGL